MQPLQTIIEQAFSEQTTAKTKNISQETEQAITEVIEQLDTGQLRVAEKQNDQWKTHQWIKKAILLYFGHTEKQLLKGDLTHFYDKVPLKFTQYTAKQFDDMATRIVPPAYVRKGAYIGANTVLMPSYVNIGAYVDSGSMIDTWATVGSCAQIGKNVHLSGGVGIGGVLEPLQHNPTIIEDDCFIGARSEIVEGVIVEHHSVIAMGVFLSQSTRIYNRATGEIHYGRIPSGSVVVPGSLPAKDGSHSLACAVIVKQVDEKTRAKVGMNELLRDV